MFNVWYTRFVGVDVAEVPSLPVMKLLLCLSYILVTAFLACKAVDNIAALTSELMFDLKCGVSGRNMNGGSKGAKFAGVATFVAAF